MQARGNEPVDHGDIGHGRYGIPPDETWKGGFGLIPMLQDLLVSTTMLESLKVKIKLTRLYEKANTFSNLIRSDHRPQSFS